MNAVPGRFWIVLAAVALAACSGDSNTAPSPPAGTANKVPRVLAITSANGKRVPAVVYTSRDGTSDTRVDSGSATLQDDSMLVIRTYYTELVHGTTGGAAPWSFTGAGVLDASGVAVFHYTNGPADTVRVLPNGGVVVALSIKDQNLSVPFATLTFTSPYNGVALNPMMRVRGFAPGQAAVGSGNLTLLIVGSNFMPATTVKWGNVDLHVTYGSSSQLSADVPAALLTTAGTVPLTLTNPGPGGGLRVYSYDVVAPAPTISALAPATVLQGSTALSLQVTGSNFTAQSVVKWNGAPRPTTYVSPTQLSVSILSGDLLNAGAVQVTVQTPPPGGGTSNVAGFAIVGASDQALAMVSTTFSAYRLVADPVRSLVYASAMEGGEPRYPNSIVALDPGTGQVAWSLDMQHAICSVAVSDDGQFMYVTLFDGSTIARVNLATHAIEATYDVGSVIAGQTLQPTLMGVLPGHPHSVAVTVANNSRMSTAGGDFAVFDDGVPRTNYLTGNAAPREFVFAPDGSLYGITQDGLAEDITVDASGLTVRSTASRSILYENYQLIGTRAYSSLGMLYDPVTGNKTPLSGFTTTGALTSSADGRYFYSVGGTAPYLRVFDTAQNAYVGSVQIPTTDPSSVLTATRWGTDGIAFAAGGKVYFMRASIIH